MKCWLQGRCECDLPQLPRHRNAPSDVFVAQFDGVPSLRWLFASAGLDQRLSSVGLKLNLCDYRDGSSGATTSPHFVRALIEALRKEAPSLRHITLIEHDSSGTRAADLFALLGFTALADELGLELFDPRAARWRQVGHAGPLPVELPEIVYDLDLLINVPKMKFHGKAAYSGALKNNFGLVRRKWKLPYHSRLCETILKCNAHMPAQLSVVDGVTTLAGRGPAFGVPHRSLLALASWDPVAVDAAGAALLGLPPALAGHIRIARSAALGSDAVRLAWRPGDTLPATRPRFDWVRFAAANALRRS
jgi:uncharacterized protein (DUF362 family)